MEFEIMKTIATLSLALCYLTNPAMANNTNSTHKQEVMRIESQWHVLQAAYQSEKKGDLQAAIVFFQKALLLGDQNAPRNALLRIYEETGQYDKAFEQVEWFLKGNQNEQGRKVSLADKNRLVQKIEAQKRGEKIEEPKPAVAAASGAGSVQNVADFSRASYAAQKQFLEKKLPENNGILKLSKQAMLAEHAGNFAKAKDLYGQLLIQKEGVVAVQGETAWALLHCAVQRTSELTGDEAREREMLVWIKGNMLDPDGAFHQALSQLMPEVIDHLKERVNRTASGGEG